MQSKAKTVTEYLLEAPRERKAVLTHLRDLCRSLLLGYEEVMEYGGPVYKRNGVAEVGFASQKNYISFYVLRTDVMKAHIDRLKVRGVTFGKGCIRYAKPERIDFNVVESLLRATRESTGPVC